MPAVKRRPTALVQLLKLQAVIYDYITGESPDMRLVGRLADAWVSLEDRKRILRGKALPGEELRASTSGIAARALLKRARLHKLPEFSYKAAQVVDVASCGPETPSGSGVPSPGVQSTPQSSEVSQAQRVADSSH